MVTNQGKTCGMAPPRSSSWTQLLTTQERVWGNSATNAPPAPPPCYVYEFISPELLQLLLQ